MFGQFGDGEGGETPAQFFWHIGVQKKWYKLWLGLNLLVCETDKTGKENAAKLAFTSDFLNQMLPAKKPGHFKPEQHGNTWEDVGKSSGK